MARARKPARRARGEGSLRHRPAKNLWVARIDLDPTTDADGNPVRRRLEKAFRLQADAVQWLTDRKVEIAKHGRTADPTITVARWGDEWLRDMVEPRRKPATTANHRSALKVWILPAIGKQRLARLTPAHVRQVTAAVTDAGKSSTTARAVHATLSAMLESARREGVLTENPADKVDPPPRAVSSRGALTADETRAVLTAAAKVPGGSRWITMLLTGMRYAEVLGLTWECVDLDAGLIAVAWQSQAVTHLHGCGLRRDDDTWPCGRKSGGRCTSPTLRLPADLPYRALAGTAVLLPTKTRKVRAVPILPPVHAALIRHRDETATQPNPHGLVWHTPTGGPLYAQTDRAGWAALVKACGLPPSVTPHWARHGVATLLLEAGVDVKVVGEIVGHATPTITRGTYQHVSSELARAGMAKLGELVAGGPPTEPPAR